MTQHLNGGREKSDLYTFWHQSTVRTVLDCVRIRITLIFMSFSSSEKDFSAVFQLVSTWRLHRKFIWIGILGKTFLGVFHRQIKVKKRTESCSHINFFPRQILVLISWMVSFIIFDGVCSVGSQRAVYMRENKLRTARKPRLILAEGFWYGLIQAAACWSLERLLRTLCFQLYPRPSRPRDARCSGGKMSFVYIYK